MRQNNGTERGKNTTRRERTRGTGKEQHKARRTKPTCESARKDVTRNKKQRDKTGNNQNEMRHNKIQQQITKGNGKKVTQREGWDKTQRMGHNEKNKDEINNE